MSRILAFGEIMMRLNPAGYLTLRQADAFQVTYAGAEANTLIALAQYGHDAQFVTRLPAHEVGQCAVDALRKYGVGTNLIVRGGERLGIYFLEKGASQRASMVQYDRAGSAIARASRGDFDWDKILQGAEWFHLTGITPALGGELPEICMEAVTKAKQKGIPVSFDMNYRAKLWTKEKAEKTLSAFMSLADVCINPLGMFGLELPPCDAAKGWIDPDACADAAQKVYEQFGCRKIAMSLRGQVNASVNDWRCMLWEDGNANWSREYRMQVVDRVGGGDAFAAGVIHGISSGWNNAHTVEFAAAASCLKHSIEGDFCLVSEQDIETLSAGDGSGKVRR